MPKLFIPFGTANKDGPWNSPPQPNSPIQLLEEYADVIPGPQNTAMMRRSLSAITTPALTGRCLGAASFRNQAGTDMVFAGDSTSLYRAFSTTTATFTFSNIGGSYNTATGETWEFCEYSRTSGDFFQHIIATNFSDAIQRCTLRGTSATMTFSALITSASPPKARHLGIIGQFLVLGNMNLAVSTTANFAPSRVHWSAFGNPLNFTPSNSTQCDFEDFQSGGAVQKIISGTEYGLIFQQDQVQVMRYTGGTTIFDFSPINYAPGTPIPNSVIAHAGRVFYIASDGFKALNGLELQHIGNNIIDRHFWNTVYQDRLYQVSVGVDSFNKLVIWSYPDSDSATNNRLIGFKYDDGRFVRWTSAVEVFATIRKGIASEKFIAFDTSHKLATFTGSAVAAGFDTKALQPEPGRRWQCNGIRLVSDNAGTGTTQTGTVTVKVADSPMPASTPASTTAVNLSPDLYFPVRTAGRYQRFSFTLTPNAADNQTLKWMGAELDYEILGER